MCLQWSVLRTSDVSPKCCARYIFLLFVNKFGDVIGLVTIFVFFILMSRKWQLTLYMAFLMPWTFELKMNDIFCCPFCYLGNYLGSVKFYFSVLMFLPVAWQVLHVLLSLLENLRFDMIGIFDILLFPPVKTHKLSETETTSTSHAFNTLLKRKT